MQAQKYKDFRKRDNFSAIILYNRQRKFLDEAFALLLSAIREKNSHILSYLPKKNKNVTWDLVNSKDFCNFARYFSPYRAQVLPKLIK